MTFAHEIENQAAILQGLRENYLKRWGWQITCNTPGSYWLWWRDWKVEDEERTKGWERRQKQKKTPNGTRPPKPYGIVCVGMDLAVSMTISVLDEQLELGEEDE